jgi:hypothetical protein
MDHGNIKLSNIFVEYTERNVGNVTQKVPMLVLSDRTIIGRPTKDATAFANVMHQLVCGMQITYTPEL